MKKLVVLVGVLAILTFGANAWAGFSLNITNLAGSTYSSNTSGSDIVVTSQYAAQGVTFLPLDSNGAPGTTLNTGIAGYGGSDGSVGGATFGLATNSTSANWYYDNANQIGGSGAAHTYNTSLPFTSNFIGFNNGNTTDATNTYSSNGKYYAGGEIQFTSELSSLSFSFARPNSPTGGTVGGSGSALNANKYMVMDFYNGSTLVGVDAISAGGGGSSSWLAYTSGGSTSSSFGNTGTYSGYLALNGASFNAVVLESGNPFMIENLTGTYSATPIPNTAWLLGAAGLVGVPGIKRKHLA